MQAVIVRTPRDKVKNLFLPDVSVLSSSVVASNGTKPFFWLLLVATVTTVLLANRSPLSLVSAAITHALRRTVVTNFTLFSNLNSSIRFTTEERTVMVSLFDSSSNSALPMRRTTILTMGGCVTNSNTTFGIRKRTSTTTSRVGLSSSESTLLQSSESDSESSWMLLYFFQYLSSGTGARASNNELISFTTEEDGLVKKGLLELSSRNSMFPTSGGVPLGRRS